MKKVFYSIAIMSAMLFASCSEDRGRTYETADANHDESVDQSQIRGYGDNQAAPGMNSGSMDMAQGEDMWRQNSERISGQMAADLQLTPETQTRVQQVMMERERRLSELESNYNYSETNRMGGQVAEDVDNTATTDRDRIDMDGGTMTDTRTNSADMNAERELILADSDRELRAILTPEQYSRYERNRVNYSGMHSGNENPAYNSGTMQNSDRIENSNQNDNQLNRNQQNNSQMQRNQQNNSSTNTQKNDMNN